MKAIQIMWRILIVLCLFAMSDCFAVNGKRSGLRSRPTSSGVQRSKKRTAPVKHVVRETEEERAGEVDAEGEAMAEELSGKMGKMEFASEEDYIKSLKPEVQELFNRADRLSEIGNKSDAIKLFEQLADKHQIPLAFDRLGDMHLDLVDDNPYNIVTAQRYYNLALEKGWVGALEKLIKVGKALAKMLEEQKEPPMSEAAKRMYM